MEVLRTPDDRFTDLPGYPFEPHYTEIPDGDGGTLRMHHVEAGPAEGEVVLCLHGEPSWSYLYRKMLPPLATAGFRAVAPDLVGFGRSDKPVERSDYTYQRHLDWLRSWIDAVGLRDVTLMCQDWGGHLGLRLVPADRKVGAHLGQRVEHALREARLDEVRQPRRGLQAAAVDGGGQVEFDVAQSHL